LVWFSLLNGFRLERQVLRCPEKMFLFQDSWVELPGACVLIMHSSSSIIFRRTGSVIFGDLIKLPARRLVGPHIFIHIHIANRQVRMLLHCRNCHLYVESIYRLVAYLSNGFEYGWIWGLHLSE